MRPLNHVNGLIVLLLLSAGGPLFAQGRVRLEVFTEERAPVTAQQEWLRSLASAGVEDVRIIGNSSLNKVGIQVQGTEKSRVYLVTGMISSSGDLILPGGGRYRSNEAARAARWLKDVADKGPPDKREPVTSTGLTFKQFQATHDALAPAVGFSTKGMDRAEAVRKIAEKVAVPLKVDPAALKPAEGDAVAEELSEVSRGTALACVLRPAGLCLVARAGAAGPELVIVPSKPGLEIWPVGWKPDQSAAKLLPDLFQAFNANVQNVPITAVFDAVSQRLKTPILLDHNALARHGIEPEKTLVSVPQGKMSYDRLLNRVCGKAKLQTEFRVDEAGKPLIWVTTQLPL